MHRHRTQLLIAALLLVADATMASSIVYDSMTGYVASSTSSWLNADIEQGTLIAVSDPSQSLTQAIQLVRNDKLTPMTSLLTLRFYANEAGTPGELFATAAGVVTIGARSISNVTVALPNIQVPSDAFWLTWIFATDTHGSGVVFGGATSVGTSYDKRAFLSNGAWRLTDYSSLLRGGPPVFRLTAVPLPASFWLLSVALVVTPWRGRQSRR